MAKKNQMTKRRDTQQVKEKYETKTMNATHFGGLYVFTELLHQISFYQRFNVCFEKLRKVRQSSPAQNIALLAGMIIARGERLYDIGLLVNGIGFSELQSLERN